MSIDDTEKPKTRYITVQDWNHFHPWPTFAGLRNLIFKRKENGFDAVIKKVGKRVLIDETAFFKWVDAQEYKE